MAQYQTAQAQYYEDTNPVPQTQLGRLAGGLGQVGSAALSDYMQAVQTSAPGLITVLQETEKQAASLDARLNSLRISLFGSQLNSSIECGNAKNAHVPSALETANSIARTLDRLTNTIASLEQQIGGR